MGQLHFTTELTPLAVKFPSQNTNLNENNKNRDSTHQIDNPSLYSGSDRMELAYKRKGGKGMDSLSL
jgi:hypothetical protein